MKYFNLSLVVLLVVALSLSVNAADLSDVTNNTAAIFGFEFLTTSGSSSVYSVYSNELTGTTAYWSVESPYLYNELYSINMYITLANESDIYIVLPYAYDASDFPMDVMNGNHLVTYYSSADSFTAFNSVYWGSIVFDQNSMMGTASENGDIYYQGDLYYISFKGLSAGTYLVNFPASKMILPPDGTLTPSVTFGLFVDDKTIGKSYFDSWFDPDAPLIDQVGSIQDTLKDAIDSTELRDLKIFYTLYGSFQLDQVRFNSDLGNVNSVQIFGTQLDTILNSFRSQLIDYPAALNQMSDAYIDEIRNAETPEQGEYITSVYVAKQLTLHHTAMQQASQKIDSAISDEEMDTANDYYSAEADLIAKYDQQKMVDLINYQEWYNVLDEDESVLYKNIFDWFFDESSFRFWLVIPLSMTIVCVLLNTNIMREK